MFRSSSSPRPHRSCADTLPAAIDIALEGATNGPQQAQRVAAYAHAGATWWIEALGWWRGGDEAARSRVIAGPPTQPEA